MTIKIGVRGHDMGKNTPEGLYNDLVSYGFDGIQLVLNKALIDNPQLEENTLKKVAEGFKSDKKIMLLGSYFNPIHSDKQKVAEGLERFSTQLKYAHLFDCEFVASETGSFNDDQWTYHPNNHKKETIDYVTSVFKSLVTIAEQYNKTVLIEAAYGHVAYSPSVLNDMIRNINSSNVGAIIDVYNLLNISNYHQHVDLLKEALLLMKDKIKVFHLKDFIVENDKLVQVGLGKGLMKYHEILPLMVKSNPDAYYVFEGVKKEDLQSSLAFIRSILKN